jgi:hypothetical protein
MIWHLSDNRTDVTFFRINFTSRNVEDIMFKKLAIFLSFLCIGCVLIFFIYTITLSSSIFAFNNTEDTTSENSPKRINEIDWGTSKDEECTYSGRFVTGDAALSDRT